jgi:hypothetical protein
MTTQQVPEPSAFHFRFGTIDDTPSIVAAERNSHGDKVFARLLQGSQANQTPASSADSSPKQKEETQTGARPVHDRDHQYVYNRIDDPNYRYLVIGYFRDPALRPTPSADGRIPQIEVPSPDEINSGKEHIVGFAQWHFVKGRSPEDWDAAREKARRERPAEMNQALIEAQAAPRWEQRVRILKDKDYWSRSTFLRCVVVN